MKAYLDSQPFAKQELGYAEGAQVEAVLGLRLNQALIGEMSAGKALNTAARGNRRHLPAQRTAHRPPRTVARVSMTRTDDFRRRASTARRRRPERRT